MDEMGERVPVDEMLRIAGAVRRAFPQLDVAAGADRRMPFERKTERLKGEKRRDDEQVGAQRRSSPASAPWRHAVSTPFALAACVAIASISGGDRQS
jgi:uncharacterized membrane protein YccC